jgi:hypothetical protein
MNAISSIDTINNNGVTYYLPKTHDEIAILLKDAKANNKKICVKGSGHSFPLIPKMVKENTCTFIYMSNFRSVSFDDANMTVKVEGGCNLGRDPFDITQKSTVENSLFYQVFKHGWSIPEMGGIIHQTVGGFISTGSSGGSIKYSFDEMLVDITIMTAEDPEPKIRTFSVNDPNTDDFYAAGIAMGMFGVILSATFKCLPTFNIQGTETISYVKDCSIDLFESGSNSLENFFKDIDYSRLIWWPQENINKMIVWQASKIDPVPGFTPKPYEEVPPIFGSEIPSSVAADLVYTAIGEWPKWFLEAFGNSKVAKGIADLVSTEFYPMILPKILEKFEPIDTKEKGPQKFQDYWWSGLCMDNKMNDKLMPVWFTELWIDVAKADQVMKELRAFFGESTDNTGYFCLELYASKASKFWMSPSYGHDVIRLDVFWFANSDRDPVETTFQRYWDRFEKYDFRCHWGKYLPKTVNGKPGGKYLESQYPNWANWMAKRAVYDVDNIFVNPYWQDQLKIS